MDMFNKVNAIYPSQQMNKTLAIMKIIHGNLLGFGV
jgi:hypothetical protein